MAFLHKTDVLLPRDPTSALQATTKQYVDASVAAVSSGALVDGGTPSTSPAGVFKIDFGSVS